MKKLCLFLVPLFTLLVIRGCDFEKLDDPPLDYFEDEMVSRVTLNVDWSEMEEKPTGMTVYFFHVNKPGDPIVVRSNKVDQIMVKLPVDSYDVLIFNQSETEFKDLDFLNMKSFADAEVRIKEGDFTRAFASPNRLRGNSLASSSGRINSTRSAVVEYLSATMKPSVRIYNMKATIYVDGLEDCVSVNGSISGLASGFMLGREVLDTEPLTQILNNWDISRPTQVGGTGKISISFGTFGIPNLTDVEPDSIGGEKPKLPEMDLHLDFKMSDGQVASYDFKVENLVEVVKEEDPDQPGQPGQPGQPSQPTGDTEVEIQLVVGTNVENEVSNPDVPPIPLPEVEKNSGMKVTVPGWGKPQNVNIKL